MHVQFGKSSLFFHIMFMTNQTQISEEKGFLFLFFRTLIRKITGPVAMANSKNESLAAMLNNISESWHR